MCERTGWLYNLNVTHLVRRDKVCIYIIICVHHMIFIVMNAGVYECKR